MATRGIGKYSRARLDSIVNKLAVEPEQGDITSIVAGNGLTGGGSSGVVTLATDIDGATDGTGITVATSDLILLADANDSNAVKKVNISQLPSTVAGSDGQIQYNNGGAFGGTANLVYADSTGYLGVGTTGGDITHAITLPNTGSVAGKIKATAYTTYSSVRYKQNIKPIEDPLKLVSELQGVTYNWKIQFGTQDTSNYGFIAEEVGKALPEIVEWEPNSKFAQSMDYTKIIPILVEAIKHQQIQIDTLKDEIFVLKNAD